MHNHAPLCTPTPAAAATAPSLRPCPALAALPSHLVHVAVTSPLAFAVAPAVRVVIKCVRGVAALCPARRRPGRRPRQRAAAHLGPARAAQGRRRRQAPARRARALALHARLHRQLAQLLLALVLLLRPQKTTER